MTVEPPFTPSRVTRPKYQLLMELGQGGMGVVHLAMSRGPQGFLKLVVLKMLRPQLLGDASARSMFLEEARISARLAHPNIVQVFEVLEFDGMPTMVMEYLEGQALSHILEGDLGRLPTLMYLHVITKVLSGLHAAHELRDYDGTPIRLVHRDVSPHNVFVLFDGQVKVLDFGIAKAAGSRVHTQTGELKGKIRYMAPEQLAGGVYDRRVDIFSVGVLLWEAIARRRLWGEMAEGDVMLNLLTGKVPALPDDVEVDAELRAIAEKALAPDPVRRFQTAGEFCRDLDRYLATRDAPGGEELAAFMRHNFSAVRESTNRIIDQHVKAAERASARPPAAEEQTATVTAPRPEKVRKKLKRWPLIAGALGVLAAAGIGVVLATRADDDTPAPRSQKGAAPPPASPGALDCAFGFKPCEGQCVSTDRPDYGCGNASCAACVVPNATSRCDSNLSCDIAVCYQEFDNCDGDPKNGCESNVRIDPDNCGGCGRRCPDLPHAVRGCGDACTIWRCQPGYRDCNAQASDGCEARVSDNPKQCGRCGNACGKGQRCREGRCVP